MFERFTERARGVVVEAQNEARRRGHPNISTIHLLKAIFAQEEDSVARKALLDLGLTAKIVKGYYSLDGDADPMVGQIPFTKNAKDALELALREALALGHNYISAEHILLGLVRFDKGSASDVFEGEGVTAQQVREKVIHMLRVEHVKLKEGGDTLDLAFELARRLRASSYTVVVILGGTPVVRIDYGIRAWFDASDLADFAQVASEFGASFSVSELGPTFNFR